MKGGRKEGSKEGGSEVMYMDHTSSKAGRRASSPDLSFSNAQLTSPVLVSALLPGSLGKQQGVMGRRNVMGSAHMAHFPLN